VDGRGGYQHADIPPEVNESNASTHTTKKKVTRKGKKSHKSGGERGEEREYEPEEAHD
jgi:hypothetical protein